MSAPALAPAYTDPELVAIGDWMPSRWTRSLTGTEDFTTDADRLLVLVAMVWRTPEVEAFLADVWQVWLLRHVLETYPPDWPVVELRGQLRFRQVVISVARQNGKSVLGAILAFYFLVIHTKGPRVVSIASREGQARIVYDRVRYVIGTIKDPNPRAEWLAAGDPLSDYPGIIATESRGLKYRGGGGIYQTLPNDDDAVQGEPISGCVYDELHIGRTAVWSAIVKGQKARRNSMLVGITTAGDANSLLLAGLYETGAAAIDYAEACLAAGEWTGGDEERFGFFVWEAEDDQLTEANLVRASPGIACGRISLATAASDARNEWKLPADETGVIGRDRVVRFDLNRFVEGAADTWASLPAWKAGAGELELEGPRIFGLERTEGWEWATITATAKTAEGIIATELVASLEAPNHEQLVAVGKALVAAHPGSTVALRRRTLNRVGLALEEEAGLEVWRLTADEEAAAAATAKSAIARRRIVHAGDRILGLQMPRARRRDLGDSWRISPTLSIGDVDAVLAMVVGVHVADVRAEDSIQLW